MAIALHRQPGDYYYRFERSRAAEGAVVVAHTGITFDDAVVLLVEPGGERRYGVITLHGRSEFSRTYYEAFGEAAAEYAARGGR